MDNNNNNHTPLDDQIEDLEELIRVVDTEKVFTLEEVKLAKELICYYKNAKWAAIYTIGIGMVITSIAVWIAANFSFTYKG